MANSILKFKNTNLERIRNKNEKRVIQAMNAVLPEIESFCGCDLCVADVYAATLNSLPAHYIQYGGIALRSTPEREDDVKAAVRQAAEIVVENPNHT